MHACNSLFLQAYHYGSRKVYAVLQSELTSNDATSGDDDYVATPAKRSKSKLLA